ncbi:hypothetical protein Tco_0371783 [Tanacetum coccineum]
MANTSLNENCSAVILKKLLEKLGDPGKFLIPSLVSFRSLKCKAQADPPPGASINLIPLSVWKELGLPELISTQMTLELANRDICTPKGIARDVFVLVGKFTFPAILSLNEILRDVNDDIFDPEEDIIENLLNLDKTKDLPPYHDNHLSGNPTPISEPETKSSSSSPTLISLEEGNDDLLFDAESDLRELEYLLNHDPIKEMDSILEDSVDENSINNNLNDTISEMFTDEHALDYSSPPLWDNYDDELFDLEPDNDYVYDDPFDFKEEKIKESKIRD